MPERRPRNINASVHQIRADTGHNPFSGLAVTKGKDGLLHIDPRPMPGYHGQVPSQQPEHWLALSPAYRPELTEQSGFQVVRRLSLRASILNAANLSPGDRRKFRARQTLFRAEEGYALVGVVKHDPEGIHGRAFHGPASEVIDLGSYRETSKHSRGSLVSLLLMKPDGRFTFVQPPKDVEHSTKFEVINDPKEGIIVKRFAAASLASRISS